MSPDAASAVDASLSAAREHFERNRPRDAEVMLERLRQQVPRNTDVAVLLFQVLQSQGRLGAACEALFAACEANAFEPAFSLRCGEWTRQCGRHDVAERICAATLARGPASAAMLALAGNVARERGDFATARKHYLAALEAGADPEREQLLGALAHARRYRSMDDPDIARFTRQFTDARFSPRARASAGFALAKTQSDLGAYEKAAAVLRDANAMVRQVLPWSAADWDRQVASYRTGRVAAIATTDPTFVPVFIVGMPRTGTTLTATLLARATGAVDRGELRSLRFIAGQMMAGGHLGSIAAVGEAASLYRRLAVQDDAPGKWYIDQDPMNFRYLNIAAAMFPQARVIHLRRDLRDAALSLWSQDFAHPDLAFAYDFGDIARFAAGHDALMAHWLRELRIPVFELEYETLVSDPHATLAKLGDFIGASVNNATVPHDPGAPVQSASVWQARQPVYTTSIGRWKHYAPYVPELAAFGAGQP